MGNLHLARQGNVCVSDDAAQNAFKTMTPEILLVDDNEIQGATRQAILTRAGIPVAIARKSEEALRLLQTGELRSGLRLVITDHLMPGMNGPELVQQLRLILPTLPVLVLSGLPGAEAEYAGLDVTFRLKPFPPDELIHTARSLMIDPVRRRA